MHLSDCTSRHQEAATAYWSDKRQTGYVVTLEGGPVRERKTHAFHVLAGSIEGAIATAKANNHYVKGGKVRCVKVRLECPCDARGWA